MTISPIKESLTATAAREFHAIIARNRATFRCARVTVRFRDNLPNGDQEASLAARVAEVFDREAAQVGPASEFFRDHDEAAVHVGAYLAEAAADLGLSGNMHIVEIEINGARHTFP